MAKLLPQSAQVRELHLYLFWSKKRFWLVYQPCVRHGSCSLWLIVSIKIKKPSFYPVSSNLLGKFVLLQTAAVYKADGINLQT